VGPIGIIEIGPTVAAMYWMGFEFIFGDRPGVTTLGTSGLLLWRLKGVSAAVAND